MPKHTWSFVVLSMDILDRPCLKGKFACSVLQIVGPSLADTKDVGIECVGTQYVAADVLMSGAGCCSDAHWFEVCQDAPRDPSMGKLCPRKLSLRSICSPEMGK
jgi:hypothetical protein